MQDLRIFQGGNYNSVNSFTSKVANYIKTVSNPAYKIIYGDKKVVDDQQVYVAYCDEHSEFLTNCVCVALEEEEKEKFDWIFCDSCGKWYHFNCEKIESVD